MVCNTPSENTVQHFQFRLQKLRNKALKWPVQTHEETWAELGLEVHIFWILGGSPFFFFWLSFSLFGWTICRQAHSILGPTAHYTGLSPLTKVLLTQRHSSASHLCESALWLNSYFHILWYVSPSKVLCFRETSIIKHTLSHYDFRRCRLKYVIS